MVEIGATPTFNIKLVVGAGNETVRVSAADSLELNTTDPQLDSMLPPQEVTDLPLEINGNMRQITSFATLAPGVRTGPYGSVTVEGGASGQINSAGNYYNGLQIDTASDINSDPPYEMVDQFRVIRNLFSARYGMVQGAVDYNMRSGTNKLHGDAFLIDRNSVFDSAGFFPTHFNSAGKADCADRLRRRTGAAPSAAPWFCPSSTTATTRRFSWAASTSSTRTRASRRHSARFPPPAEKQGDFSNFVDTNGKLIPIYDPQTGQQFQCNGNQPNVICPNRIDPLSQVAAAIHSRPQHDGNQLSG